MGTLSIPEAWNKFWSSARTTLRDLWNRFDLTFEWWRCMYTYHDANIRIQILIDDVYYIYANQGWQFNLYQKFVTIFHVRWFQSWKPIKLLRGLLGLDRAGVQATFMSLCLSLPLILFVSMFILSCCFVQIWFCFLCVPVIFCHSNFLSGRFSLDMSTVICCRLKCVFCFFFRHCSLCCSVCVPCVYNKKCIYHV